MKWVLLLVLVSAVDFFDLTELSKVIQSGQKYHKEYLGKGTCWDQTLTEMAPRCSYLNQSTQSQITVRLTNCHLQDLGFEEFTCFSKLSDCKQNMTGEAYHAYTTFYPHVYEICVFVAFENWQHQTSKTISDLEEASDQTLHKLQFASEVTQEMLRSQDLLNSNIEQSLEKQENIQKSLNLTYEELNEFSRFLIGSAKDIQSQLWTQQEFIAGWLDKIYQGIINLTYLQEVILGELWDINSLVFYLSYILSIWVLTSCPQTSKARAPLLYFYALLIALEYFLQDSHNITRSFSVFTSLVYLFYTLKTYKEYDKLAYEMLVDIISPLKKILTPRTVTYSKLRTLKGKPLTHIPEVFSELEEDLRRRKPKCCDETLSRTFLSLSAKKPRVLNSGL